MIQKTNIKFLFLLSCLGLFFLSCEKPEEPEAPITFTFFSSDLTEPKYFNDEVANEITNRTGVNLDLQYTTINPTEAIHLMAVNDTLPDLIFAKGDLSKLIEAKDVIPLDDYIEKYGANMKKLYGKELSKLRNSLDDPSIYTVGCYDIKKQNYETGGTFQLQHSVLKEFGYPPVKTLRDYENILLAYKNKYPEINGQKTIGMSLLTYDWYWFVGLSNIGNYVIGYPDDGQWIVDQETLKATYKFLHPEMNLFYKWLNKIYHEELLDPESFTQDYELWNKKMTSGAVLGTAFPLWLIQNVNNTLANTGKSDRAYAYLPMTVNESYKDPSMKDYGFSGGWGIAITKNCKDPVRAFKFLDYLCSEEAQILINWGIEGRHYFYTEDGVRKSNERIREIAGVGKWLYPFPQAGSGYIDSTGNTIQKQNKDSIIRNYTYVEKETLNAYDAKMWIDLFPSSEELGPSKHGQVWQYNLNTAMTSKIEKADTYVKDSLIQMIIGPEENFDASWNKMTNQLVEMGIPEIEEEMTKLIQMKIQLWEK